MAVRRLAAGLWAPARSYRHSSTKMSDKILIAFDFDLTIIKENSDTYVQRILPDKGKAIRNLRKSTEWIPYMQFVFEDICKAGLQPNDVLKCLEEIPLVAGMDELLTNLNRNGHEAIIISDCNTVFVESILKKKGLLEAFKEVFVNPSKFKENGCLEIGMYHKQDKCELSAVNLCKGQVLEEYIEQRKNAGQIFKFVAYVGDGSNDYCPSLRLSVNDLIFPRKNFELHKIILKEKRTNYRTKGKVIPWENALEIQEALFTHLKCNAELQA